MRQVNLRDISEEPSPRASILTLKIYILPRGEEYVDVQCDDTLQPDL